MTLLAWCILTPCFADSYEKHLTGLKVDEKTHSILVYMDDALLGEAPTEKVIKKIYKKVTKDVHKALPREYSHYEVRIFSRGVEIEKLLCLEQPTEDKKHHKPRHGGWWGKVAWDEDPWVRNASRPVCPTAALNGRHISLWASHGRYYDVAQARWKWQRPNLFCTTEDLFTQTIVIPYLIPMLESAGATVFTPRERDWQTEEVIVDNDDVSSGYMETNIAGSWKKASSTGFAMPEGVIEDGYNPFEKGTARKVGTTHATAGSAAVYTPSFAKTGRYAVYVSYVTEDNSVSDAHYTVWHQGMRTDFRVNQTIGGGTWVYLGTFEFDQGCSEGNRVEVTSDSRHKGVVTTDAVRFGGGMGNIVRGESVSGLPRCLEGARYYAQWAGLPYESLSLYKGEDDYKDDINVRSLMTNWIAGGSPYAPTKQGKGVPIDLSLAVHSDAGYHKDFTSIFGSLAVCTTDFNDGKLDAGLPRNHSKDFATMLLERSKDDLASRYGYWKWRELYDKNYSETRLPAMPSAIFETLSHQSFPDMRLAHDPDFKFTIARSIYKTILLFEAEAHGEKVVVQPLSPSDFSVVLDNTGNALLSWKAVNDEKEPTATPTSYNIYTAVGGMGYDNGTNVKQQGHTIALMPDLLYRFRVTAVNDGGESFPTEELSVVWHGNQAPTILVVNGFQRLAAPQVVDSDSIKGFDMDADPGVSFGLTAGWCGRQYDNNIGSASYGSSSSEQEGQFVQGNTFNYVYEHAMAIASAYRYNVASCTRSVVENGNINLSNYSVIDLILGNERNDGYSLSQYKTFTPALRRQLSTYVTTPHHALLVSGSYVASDMQTEDEKQFLAQVLHTSHAGRVRSTNDYVVGLQQTTALTNKLNPDHYATTWSDVLSPLGNGAFTAMQYSDGQSAAVAYKGLAPTFVMGFPFECIGNSGQRAYNMRGILSFLLQ